MIKAILAEERFAPEDHQRYAAMASLLLTRLVVDPNLVVLFGISLDVPDDGVILTRLSFRQIFLSVLDFLFVVREPTRLRNDRGYQFVTWGQPVLHQSGKQMSEPILTEVWFTTEDHIGHTSVSRLLRHCLARYPEGVVFPRVLPDIGDDLVVIRRGFGTIGAISLSRGVNPFCTSRANRCPNRS